MAHSQSPGYPNLSLRRAVSHAQRIFDADRRNPIDRAVAAKHIGFTSLSGPAQKALATLGYYGLLGRSGKGQVEVTQLAVDILHPADPAQKKEALRRAAYSPKLFQTLRERFKGDVFSEEALRSHLLRENFLQRAVNPIIKGYTDTCRYLKQEGVLDSHSNEGAQAAEYGSPVGDDDEVVYGGASVGDRIQWEVDGAFALDAPHRVRAVQTHEGQEWVFIEGSETGIPMGQVIVEQKGGAMSATPPTLELFPKDELKEGWQEERLIDDGGEEIFIRYEGEPSVSRYEFIRDYLDFKLERLKKQTKTEGGAK